MSLTANTPQEAIEPDFLVRSSPVDALSTLLDMHLELSAAEAKEERWPISRTILFATIASAALWGAIWALVTAL